MDDDPSPPQPQLGSPDLETPVGLFSESEVKDELVTLANWSQVATLTDDARQILKDRLDEVRAEATRRGLIPS